jgi:hypothetical protein
MRLPGFTSEVSVSGRNGSYCLMTVFHQPDDALYPQRRLPMKLSEEDAFACFHLCYDPGGPGALTAEFCFHSCY